MTLPPGRARLGTKPTPTGSPGLAITMGTVVVTFLAANADGVSVATIKSTLRRTRSVANSSRRLGPLPSAKRYSMAMFFPSVHPSLLSSCRNAFTRTELPEAVLPSRKPMRQIFPVCCAWTEPQSAQSMAQRIRTAICFFMSFEVSNVGSLLDDLVRSCQHVWRNRQADLFGGFEIDNEFKLRRLLNWKFAWLGSFENLVYVACGAAVTLGFV